MISALSLGAACSGALAIGADSGSRRHAAFYALKPITTLLLAAVAWVAASGEYRAWVLAALACSLAGDVCLMFAGRRWFLAGLGSFLAAHALFVGAFLSGVPADAVGAFVSGSSAWLWPLLAAGALVGGVLVLRAGRLRLPVAVYCLALVAMAVAASVRHQWLGPAALPALLGAALFVVSDSALGVRQFVRNFRGAQALILSTYWGALWLIALSA